MDEGWRLDGERTKWLHENQSRQVILEGREQAEDGPNQKRPLHEKKYKMCYLAM